MTENRYYLIELDSNGNRMRAIQQRITRLAGVRDRSDDLLHWSTSDNGQRAIVQARTTDEEHAWAISQNYVSLLGMFDLVANQPDAAVLAYVNANADAWRGPWRPGA